MHRKLFTILFLFTIQLLNAQILRAKVYDATTTAKGIKVYNKTQERVTATNDEGNFSIPAKVGDSIVFESLFHHPKTILVSDHHFGKTTVFELKKIINELDEVKIESEPEEPIFVLETYNKELQDLIKEDIKRNPHLYVPEEAYYGANLLGILNLVAKLFKKKKKLKTPVYKPITYCQVDSLFNNSSLFNTRLLKNDLKISIEKTKLFFDFCAATDISSEFLKETKQMELLEIFLINSKAFLKILEEFEKKKSKKD